VQYISLLEKSFVHEELFTFNQTEEKNMINTIGRTLLSRLESLYKGGHSNPRLIWLKDLLESEMEKHGSEDAVIYSYAAMKVI
ncbi:hypothetical protein PFISCL1PPCAC_1605, partial [Pristionchus fissidentatus]